MSSTTGSQGHPPLRQRHHPFRFLSFTLSCPRAPLPHVFLCAMGMPPPHSVQRVGEDEEDEPIQEALRGGVASRKSSISYATAAEAAVHFEEGQGGKRGLRDARSNAPTERDDAPTTTTAISEQVRRPAGPWRESSQGASSVDDEEADNALLGLAAPPSYDVHVRALSISPPPWRAYIPAPIPIPIPRSLTKMMGLGPQGKKSEGNGKGKRIEVESRSDKREEDVEKAQTAQSSGERADLEAGATRLADMAPITALPTRLQSNGGLTEEEQEEEGVGSIVREVEWKVRGGEMAAM